MGIPAGIGVAGLGTPPVGDRADIVVAGTLGAVGPGLCFPFRGSFNVNIWPSINTAMTTTAGSLAVTLASGTGIAAGAAIDSVNVPPGSTLKTLAGTAGTLALPAISLVGTIDSTSKQITGLQRTAGLGNAVISSPNIPAGTQVVSIIQAAQTGPGGFPPVLGIVEINQFPTASNQNEPIVFQLGAGAITVTGADAAALFIDAAMTFSGTVQLEKSYDGGNTYLVAGVGGGGQQAVYTAGTAVGFVVSEPETDVLYRVNCPVYTSGVINYRLSQTAIGATAWGVPPG